MMYNDSVFKDNDDMLVLIDRLGLNPDDLEMEMYYHPGALMYDMTLILSLTDSEKSVDVEIGDYYHGTMKSNKGEKYIGRDFSSKLIEEIDDYICDKSC